MCVPTFSLYKIAQTVCMHVKASVSARMSLVRLVLLFHPTVFLHFTEQINDDDDDDDDDDLK